MDDGFYKTPGWFRARHKAITRWRSAGLPCAFCGSELMWAMKGSIIVDHIINRKKRPDLALEPTNLQVVHHECNSRKWRWLEANQKEQIGLDGLPDSWR